MNYEHILLDDTDNYRTQYSSESIRELANSFKSRFEQTDGGNWLLQPVGVVWLEDNHPERANGKTHKLLFGFRRFHAIKLLVDEGVDWVSDVPVTVLDDGGTSTAIERLHAQLVENLQREDPNTMDTAYALDRLRTAMGTPDKKATQKTIADAIGKSDGWVAQRLRLLNMAPRVQEALLHQEIEISHARELQRLASKGKPRKLWMMQQEQVADAYIAKGWTYGQLKSHVQKILDIEEQEAKQAAAPTEEVLQGEPSIAEQTVAAQEAADEDEREGSSSDSHPALSEGSGESPKVTDGPSVGTGVDRTTTLVVAHSALSGHVSRLKRSVVSSLQGYGQADNSYDRELTLLEAAFFAGAQRTMSYAMDQGFDTYDPEDLFEVFTNDAARFGVLADDTAEAADTPEAAE